MQSQRSGRVGGVYNSKFENSIDNIELEDIEGDSEDDDEIEEDDEEDEESGSITESGNES